MCETTSTYRRHVWGLVFSSRICFDVSFDLCFSIQKDGTVDGRSPAPVDMVNIPIIYIQGFIHFG